jgi:hypothetical protein
MNWQVFKDTVMMTVYNLVDELAIFKDSVDVV